jgi:hypothetical protein
MCIIGQLRGAMTGWSPAGTLVCGCARDLHRLIPIPDAILVRDAWVTEAARQAADGLSASRSFAAAPLAAWPGHARQERVPSAGPRKIGPTRSRLRALLPD